MSLKDTVAAALTSAFASRFFEFFIRGRGSIFMLHRFADPALGNEGHDTNQLRRTLELLRHRNVEFLSIDDLVRRIDSGMTNRTHVVAFTVDDGYADFATVGAPIFAEFDCPVTVFLVTGVLDGQLWYWWDIVEMAFALSPRRHVRLELLAERRVEIDSGADRQRASSEVIEALKLVPDEQRREWIRALPELLEVDLPERPPSACAAMTWDQVRRCAKLGATFGAHTVTHPVLSRAAEDLAHFEMSESLRRIREETTAVSEVFCYPNGTAVDFGPREQFLAQALGYRAAVSTMPGHISRQAGRNSGMPGLYALPRFSYQEQPGTTLQVTSGVEQVKMLLRLPSRG